MSRGGRSPQGFKLGAGEAFRLTPVAWARAARPGDPAFEHDLSADVAAALLDTNLTTLLRWAKHGRFHARTGEQHTLRSWLPYGQKPNARRYYSLVDLEAFAVDAWVRPRALQYGLIPRWYLEKHSRKDLFPLGKTAPIARAAAGGLPVEEQAAIDAGWPVGAYLDGDDVFSPSGVLLNPGPDDSPEMHALAATTLQQLGQPS